MHVRNFLTYNFNRPSFGNLGQFKFKFLKGFTWFWQGNRLSNVSNLSCLRLYCCHVSPRCLSEIQRANIAPLTYMSIWPLLSFRGLKHVVHSELFTLQCLSAYSSQLCIGQRQKKIPIIFTAGSGSPQLNYCCVLIINMYNRAVWYWWEHSVMWL